MAIIDSETLRGLRAGTYYVTFTSLWQSLSEGESSITASARDAKDESYATALFKCEGFMDFGGSLVRDHSPLRAYASVSSPRFNELWQTFLAIVRAGDDVRIVWSANGKANCHIHEAKLNVDTCELEIKRPIGQSGRTRRLRFHIDQTICPANTARMFTQGVDNFHAVDGPREFYAITARA